MFRAFRSVALVIIAVCLLAAAMTGDPLPILVLAGVLWALWFTALSISQKNR